MANQTNDTTTQRIAAQIIERSKLYKGVMKFATANLTFSVLALSLSGALLYKTTTYQVPPQSIQVAENGTLFTKVPLHLPNKTDGEVKQWYLRLLTKTFDYHYRNMERHPSTLSRDYSPDALRSIDNFINSSNFSVRVRNNHGIVEPVIADEITLESGEMNGRLVYRITTKAALMVYMQGKPLRAGVYEIETLIAREDEDINPEGLKAHTVTLKEIR